MKKWNLGWGVVSKCNMACEFCYSKNKRKESKDLGYDDWIKFIDENYECINTINYGTGENTIDDKWFDLVAYIRNKYPQIRQALTTNGHLSEVIKNDERKKNIIINSIDEIDVSLDYADEEKHNKFRGQPKAYKWAIDTLDFCYKNNVELTIVFLGSAVNTYRENIDGIFEIAKKFGAKVRMNMYRPTEGIDEKHKKFIISYEEVRDLLYYIGEKYNILGINDNLFGALFTDNASDTDSAGVNSLRILSDGNITPSTYLIKDNYVVGNIRENNILKKLNDNNDISQIIHVKIPDECKNCEYVNACKGGVYDRRYLWNGSLDSRDPYCPFIKEKKPIIKKVKSSNEKFESIHDGYLPTMFFKY